jgi:hypothetical protein
MNQPLDAGNIALVAFLYFAFQIAIGLAIGLSWRGPTGTKFTLPRVIAYIIVLTATCSGLAYLGGAMDVAIGVLCGTGAMIVLRIISALVDGK